MNGERSWAAAMLGLLLLPVLMAAQPDPGCYPGPPELIVEGTVFKVPSVTCSTFHYDTPQRCLVLHAPRCKTTDAAVIKSSTGGTDELVEPRYERNVVGRWHSRDCDVAAGPVRISFCPYDASPTACDATIEESGTTEAGLAKNHGEQVQIRVERVVLGDYDGAALAFWPDRAYEAGERVRLSLARQTVPGPWQRHQVEAYGAFVVWPCYRPTAHRPTHSSKGARGCFGCGSVAVVPAGLLMFMRRRRSR